MPRGKVEVLDLMFGDLADIRAHTGNARPTERFRGSFHYD